MPKSRTRKNHKQKVAAFRKRVDDRKKSFERQMREMYERQQMEALDKQVAGGQVDSQQLEGLNTDDFKLEENIPQMESTTGIIEGITSPDQL